jgi:NAD(P)-dependent dehydrogenase (short-subunit alcohol dehydrogenase family)
VNNAGISMKGFNLDVVRGTLGVNFFAALRVTRGFAQLVVNGGNIVMVSSGMGALSAYAPAIQKRFLDPALDIEGLTALVAEFEAAVAAGTHQQQGWPSSACRVSKAALNALTRAGREAALSATAARSTGSAGKASSCLGHRASAMKGRALYRPDCGPLRAM